MDELNEPRLLTRRPLAVLLRLAADTRGEGLVVVRDREGLRHGVFLQGGYAVGAHVAGRFDPLLELLRRQGLLSPLGYRACIEALYAATVRSGVLAVQIGGVAPGAVREVLCAQLVARIAALMALAHDEGHDAHFELGSVPTSELCVRMPVGSLLRRAAPIDEGHASGQDAARRKLRATAKLLHPDRHGDLDPEARKQLADLLAQATAAYHGFS